MRGVKAHGERLAASGREVVARNWPALLVGAACVGLAASVWASAPLFLVACAACIALAAALLSTNITRLALAATALALAGLWWGTLRGDAL